jgi:hypothetical protein
MGYPSYGIMGAAYLLPQIGEYSAPDVRSLWKKPQPFP